MTATLSFKNTLCAANISSPIHAAKYAVRGPILQRANEISSDLKSNNNLYPFTEIVFCNTGNPHALAQKPLTFHRQVLACLLYPPLIQQNIFAKDVILRAQTLLNGTSAASIGEYTAIQGYYHIRENVALFIEHRDGFPSNADDIFLSAGASSSIKHVISCLVSNKTHGILVPIPQYPLYSALITLNNAMVVGYYLDERNDWLANSQSIEQSIIDCMQNGIIPRAIVIINPGNPTGQCMPVKYLNEMLSIAHKYSLVVLADEVYQENIYDRKLFPFVSIKKCLRSHFNTELQSNLELISFHSVSKGCFGECGLRGGYMELTNILPEAKAILLKLQAINLCPNTVGQCMVDLMVNPPKKGDESYALFVEEYEAQYESLKERATIISEALNAIEGISCNKIYGAMYAFPRIHLSDTVVENVIHAYKNANSVCSGKSPCFVYCWELLEKTGVCVIPGSGFRQKPNTYHFRTTLLPTKEKIEYCVKSISAFHQQFVIKYSKKGLEDEPYDRNIYKEYNEKKI